MIDGIYHSCQSDDSRHPDSLVMNGSFLQTRVIGRA
jgi:hypothetical protein